MLRIRLPPSVFRWVGGYSVCMAGVVGSLRLLKQLRVLSTQFSGEASPRV